MLFWGSSFIALKIAFAAHDPMQVIFWRMAIGSLLFLPLLPLLTRKAQRLTEEDRDYLELMRLEMSFVDQMRRIYTLAKRIAKVVLPPVLAQRD